MHPKANSPTLLPEKSGAAPSRPTESTLLSHTVRGKAMRCCSQAQSLRPTSSVLRISFYGFMGCFEVLVERCLFSMDESESVDSVRGPDFEPIVAKPHHEQSVSDVCHRVLKTNDPLAVAGDCDLIVARSSIFGHPAFLAPLVVFVVAVLLRILTEVVPVFEIRCARIPNL